MNNGGLYVGTERRLAGMSLFERVLLFSVIWLFVCASSAIPSYILAHSEGYDTGAMALGVLCFVAVYTAACCTDTFDRRWSNDPVFRRTTLAGYLLRAISGAIFPLGVMIDMMPGALATDLVRNAGFERHGFADTFLTTLLQGCFLNAILAVFMLVLYVVQVPFARDQRQPRGFMVVPTPPASDSRPPGH